MSISSTIKSIQDIMRKDVGVDGDAQRIGQLVWLLFLKIFDDRELEWELMDDNYRSPIPESCRWRTWAADPEGMTGDALKDFIDNNLFPQLQNLHEYSNTPSAFVVRSVFEDAYNYMKSGQLLRQVINKIQQGVDFNKAQERHEFGNLYEQLLRDLQNAGNAGEFYTPRPVTEFMVRMVDPKLDEKVMDPACGTGGFLTCTIEHKRSRYVKTAEDERTLQASIYGVEKKPLPHLLATTNMILHGIEVPNQIRHDNTLARPLISWGPKERVDCIVANPPFGGMEEDGIETNFPAAFRTRETADLFLVLIMHLLKDGGRAAVVLPDGFLFGEGIKSRIKKAADRVQPAHHRSPAQRCVQPLHRYQDQPAVLHQGHADQRGVVLRTSVPSRREELLQDAPHARRRVRRGGGLVGQRGRRLCRTGGKRVRLEGQRG